MIEASMSSPVVGIFPDLSQAVHAVEDLKRAGFEDQQLALSDPRDSTRSENNGNEEGAAQGLFCNTGLGSLLPEDKAFRVEEQVRAGRVVVAVDAGWRVNDAKEILAQSGRPKPMQPSD
jgi:hypothetical protein